MRPCSNCFEGKRGDRVVMIICMDKDRPNFKKLVTPEICGNCSPGAPPEKPQKPHMSGVEITPQGTLIYQRGGWEVPPIPPGYERRSSDPDSDDSWILDPVDAVCEHLELSPAEVGSCGYQRIKRRCKLIDSFVGPKTCGTCRRK